MAGGSGNKQKPNKSKSLKPVKASLFVEGGLLSDWSPGVDSPPWKGMSKNSGNCSSTPKNKFGIGSGSCGKLKASSSNSRIIEPQRLKMNAVGYSYPQIDPLPDGGDDEHNKLDESHPVASVDTKESKIVAYVDQTPVMESETVKYTYNYDASFEVDDSSHIGLGFCDEAEDNPSCTQTSPVTEQKEISLSDSSSSKETDTGSDDEESIESSESGDTSNSSDSDGSYNSDCDIDNEIAKDYFEGIGGSYKVVKCEQLARHVHDNSDDDDIYGVCFNDIVKRLGGIAIQDASKEYGMKKRSSSKKSGAKSIKFGGAIDDWSIDDPMLVKDPRSLYSQKKKYAAKLPQSWPSKGEKSNRSRRFPVYHFR